MSAKLRRWLRGVGLVLMVLAALPCFVRVMWIYPSTSTSRGKGIPVTLVSMDRGNFRISPGTMDNLGAENASTIFNRQIEIGFDPWWKISAGVGGMQVPVTAVLGGIASLLLLTSLWPQGRLPGHCRCGYKLDGLRSGVCPECGAGINAAGDPKASVAEDATSASS